MSFVDEKRLVVLVGVGDDDVRVCVCVCVCVVVSASSFEAHNRASTGKQKKNSLSSFSDTLN